MFRPFSRCFPACVILLAGTLSMAAAAVAATSPAKPAAGPRKPASPQILSAQADSVSRVRDSLRVADSLRVREDSLVVSRLLADSARTADSLRNARNALRQPPPDSTYRWPKNSWSRPCADPLDGVGQCWRDNPRWALQETGFPGIRTGAVDLSSLEPLRVTPFYQGTPAASPYRTGGQLPFRRHEERSGNANGAVEAWAPVQPLDTPVTDLHWMRGALFLNQFTLRMERMVGNRAYLGLEYHSDGVESMFYQYAFQVHQPYLGPLGRDSLSLVIHDTSHAVSARHIRPRLGFWLGPRDVIEVYADFLDNRTSLANPTNPGARDSLQVLYPAAFNAATFGALAAHAGETHGFQALFRHSAWDRTLRPRYTSRAEAASGTVDFARLEWILPKLAGAPRLRLEAQNNLNNNAFHTGALPDSTGPARQTRDDQERLEAEARPALGPAAFSLRGDGARRRRADGVTEWLGGADAEAALDLPLGFSLTGGAGQNREGAPDDLLFRWQPALGFYPNTALAPRVFTRYGAGAAWKSRYLGFGAEWNFNRFENAWLPRALPVPFQGTTPDSLALRQVNYPEETRELLRLSAYAGLGNWKLSLWNHYLLANEIRDADTATEGLRNWQLPRNVLKGQLLWKRLVLDGKLGLQTQWDWEWFSERYAYGSDMNGTSRVIRLDEYLVLDFAASMEIKTFLLYFRAMNLNHDRYATEPGVHPPGVNFRFGVDWRIRN
jgi:hypothetical protein